jgi:serine/threonine protein kinase
LEGYAPLAAPGDSEKGKRAIVGEDRALGWRPALGLAVPGREHWRLDKQLGTGSIGEVWRASHEKTHARRVFKFCYEADRLRSLKREVVVLQLLREQLGSRADIAQILDWRFDEAPFYIEMEHTEAGDLAAWAVERGGIQKVSLETRLEIVAQAADALAAAHLAGVLHKDLKPGNILIVADDQRRPHVCLTDFGIGIVTHPEVLGSAGVTIGALTEALVSSGTSVASGTRMYMAPELIEGREPTERSDIYSLGVVLYQLVAGDFARALAPGWEDEIADPLLRELIRETVLGDTDARLASASALATRLRSLDVLRKRRRRQRNMRLLIQGVIAAAVVLGVALVAFQKIDQVSEEQWALRVLPEIDRLAAADRQIEAFSLAQRARSALGEDPLLQRVWPQLSYSPPIDTEPSGATVFYRAYDSPDSAWTELGQTPLRGAEVPRTLLRWRLELEGYESREVAFYWDPPTDEELVDPTMRFVLDPLGSALADMVPVESSRLAPLGDVFDLFLANPTPRSFIDRLEVTNGQFRDFVDSAGYAREEFWTEPFMRDGQELTFAEAIVSFADTTRRPGPSSWTLGTFPEGKELDPVTGVSWFEANAYCRYKEKQLPTWCQPGPSRKVPGTLVRRGARHGRKRSRVGLERHWRGALPDR